MSAMVRGGWSYPGPRPSSPQIGARSCHDDPRDPGGAHRQPQRSRLQRRPHSLRPHIWRMFASRATRHRITSSTSRAPPPPRNTSRLLSTFSRSSPAGMSRRDVIRRPCIPGFSAHAELLPANSAACTPKTRKPRERPHHGRRAAHVDPDVRAAAPVRGLVGGQKPSRSVTTRCAKRRVGRGGAGSRRGRARPRRGRPSRRSRPRGRTLVRSRIQLRTA